MIPRSRARRSKGRKRRLGTGSVRLGLLLVGLTGINIYVFYFKPETAVSNLIAASSLGPGDRLGGKDQKAGGDPLSGKSAQRPADDELVADVKGPEPGASGSRLVEGEIGKLDTLSILLAREGFDRVALAVSTA